MSNVGIIVLILMFILLISSSLGGVVYWKRDDLGLGSDSESDGDEGDSCSDDDGNGCKSPLVCSNLICTDPAGAGVTPPAGGGGGAVGATCATNTGCTSPLVCSSSICANPTCALMNPSCLTTKTELERCNQVGYRSNPPFDLANFEQIRNLEPYCAITEKWYSTIEEARTACECTTLETPTRPPCKAFIIYNQSAVWAEFPRFPGYCETTSGQHETLALAEEACGCDPDESDWYSQPHPNQLM